MTLQPEPKRLPCSTVGAIRITAPPHVCRGSCNACLCPPLYADEGCGLTGLLHDLDYGLPTWTIENGHRGLEALPPGKLSSRIDPCGGSARLFGCARGIAARQGTARLRRTDQRSSQRLRSSRPQPAQCGTQFCEEKVEGQQPPSTGRRTCTSSNRWEFPSIGLHVRMR